MRVEKYRLTRKLHEGVRDEGVELKQEGVSLSLAVFIVCQATVNSYACGSNLLT